MQYHRVLSTTGVSRYTDPDKGGLRRGGKINSGGESDIHARRSTHARCFFVHSTPPQKQDVCRGAVACPCIVASPVESVVQCCFAGGGRLFSVSRCRVGLLGKLSFANQPCFGERVVVLSSKAARLP